MSAFDDLSLAMIPSGFKDGKLYSVIPQPKPLSGELVTDTGFDDASQWNAASGWSVSNSEATCDGTNAAQITTSSSIVANKIYKVEYSIGTKNSGNLRIVLGTFTDIVSSDENTSYTVYLIAPSSGNIGLRSASFNGSVTYLSVIEVDQIPADFDFSRGTNLAATRVNAQGLIEKGRENLLTQSNTFSSSDWTKFRTSVTGGQSGYDGSNDAWLLQNSATSTGGNLNFQQTFTGVHTFSAYVKQGTSDGLRFRLDTSGGNILVNFTLTGDGSINELNSFIDTKITSVGSGWYRCSATSENINIARVYTFDSVNGAGALEDNIYIQDAQLEQGLVATNVIETTTTTAQAGILEDMPRLDYSGGATCPSLLLEPQRQNLVTDSEYFEPSDTDWRSGGSNGVTITTNDTTSPEGLVNASKLQGGGASNDRLQFNFNTSNTKAMYSVFVKGTGDAARFSIFNSRTSNRLTYDINTSGDFTLNATIGITNHDIVDYGNGWYRISGEFATSATQVNYFQIYSDITGSGSVYLYGAQLEDNATYATSYIPTHGTSVTRAEDICQGGGNGTIFNDDEGVLFVEAASLESTAGIISLNDGSGNSDTNSIRLFFSSGEIKAQIYNSDGSINVSIVTSGANVLNFNKVALKYSQSVCSLFVNGVKIGDDTDSFSVSSLSVINFARNNPNSIFYKGKVKALHYFPEALTDTELQQLTT